MMLPVEATATPNGPAQHPVLPGFVVANVVSVNPSAIPAAVSVGNWPITAGARQPTTNSPISTAQKVFFLEFIRPPSCRAVPESSIGVTGDTPEVHSGQIESSRACCLPAFGRTFFDLHLKLFKVLRLY